MEDTLKKAILLMSEGKEEGFNAVYSETYNRVYFRAKQIMKNEEDAQDLVQIVFIEAYKSISTLEVAEALYKWLDGITYRQGMKLFRKKRDVLLSEEAEGLFDTLESNDIDSVPELTADQKATSEIIKGIIEELPELQKTAVVMYYFDNMKVEQIADIMECSTGTIKSRLNYARKYIKDRIEEKERKEGYRLHAFGLPVLWLSIKMLAEKTTLTAQAAQNVYNGACANVGLEATAISLTAGTATGAGTAIGAGTVTGAGTVAGPGAAAGAGAAGATAGVTMIATLSAKFASLSTTAKALILAGTIAVIGGGAAGAIYMISQSETEETYVQETAEGQQENGNEEVSSQTAAVGEEAQQESIGEESKDDSEEVTDTAAIQESNDMYRLMAQQCAGLLQDAASQYGMAFSQTYDIYDVDKDGTLEFIFQIGNSEADYKYVIYGYDGSNMTKVGETDTIRTSTFFGLENEEGFLARNRVYGYETVWRCTLSGSQLLFEKECEVTDDLEYLGGYELPDNAYYMSTFGGMDEESIYQNFLKVRDMVPVTETEELITLTVAAQHQISSFIGVLDNYSYYSLYMVEPEELMWMMHYYLNDCGEYSLSENTDDMPFNWKNGEITKEEFNLFFESGWGVSIPEDFTYTAGEDWDPSLDYGMRITDDGWESLIDGSWMTVQGGEVRITGIDHGLYELQGTFLIGTIDEPDGMETKSFTAKALYRGDERIYDGLEIVSFKVDY